MKSKKFLSLILALVMSLSLAVPAFAAGTSTEITGKYQAITINVTVPGTGSAQINPYGLDVSVPDAAGTGTVGKITGQQIVTKPLALQNQTAMDLNVSATVLGVVDVEKTDMKLATTTTKGTPDLAEDAEGYVAPATAKSAFVYLQMVQNTTLTGAAATVTADKIGEEFTKWAASAYDATKDVIVSTKETKGSNLVVLRAAKTNATTDAFEEYKAGSIAFFRLAGDCVVAPKTEWKATDEFKATIAFTFAPAAVTKYTITIDSAITGGTVVADVTSAAEGDTVTLTATPATGGQTATYTVKDADNNNITVTGGKFTMPAKNVTVTATFA